MKKYLLVINFLILSLSVLSKEEVMLPEIEKEDSFVIENQNIFMKNEKLNIYTKVGFDFLGEFDRYSFQDFNFNKKKASDIGFELALEVTTNVTEKLEIGAGIAYQDHMNPKRIVYSKENSLSKNKVETMQIKMPDYNSIPLYGIAKYNFDTKMFLKPYLKAVLGYSFNMKENEAEKMNTEVKDGAYAGVGLGIEKDNFFIDLMYLVNTASIETKFIYEGEQEKNINKKSDFDYTRYTLSAGYKFCY